jgi:hypothetical protein
MSSILITGASKGIGRATAARQAGPPRRRHRAGSAHPHRAWMVLPGWSGRSIIFCTGPAPPFAAAYVTAPRHQVWGRFQ